MIGSLSWKTVPVIHVGPVPIRPHGVLIAVAFVLGALLLRRSTRARGIPDEQVWRVLWWALIGALVGLRGAWLLGHWRGLHGPLEALALWHGGMSLLGGLIGAVGAGVVVLRREKLPVLSMLDLAAPWIALGIAIGRVSDLIIGDHLGKPTTLPWGFRYVGSDNPLAGAPAIGSVVHPVALYDLVLTTALIGILLWFRRRPRAPGSVIALFVMWYATGRILTDFLRTDPRRLIGLTGSQLTAIGAIGAIGALLVWRGSRARRLSPASSHLAAAPSAGPRTPDFLSEDTARGPRGHSRDPHNPPTMPSRLPPTVRTKDEEVRT